eukprot:g3016.t1
MPKKKGKKKGGKKKADSGAEPAAPVAAMPRPVLKLKSDEWVTLELKLLNWNYMNFTHKCKTDARLFQIKNLLKERHGRIANLKICKEQFAERNEMDDDMATLKSYGLVGTEKDSPTPMMYTLHYEFSPVEADDPLLLHTTGPAMTGALTHS